MKVKMTLSIGLVGRREEIIELSDDEFAGATGEELEKLLSEAWQEWAWNYIDGGATTLFLD